MASRFYFLVLCGPSRMGKTKLAESLYGAEKTYTINCQGGGEPNFKGYDKQKHDAIIFDECPWEVVHKHKMLFQAGSAGVYLQESHCQLHAVWKFLYMVPMIVCTNSWINGDTPVDAAEWIKANSIRIDIIEPVWDSGHS